VTRSTPALQKVSERPASLGRSLTTANVLQLKQSGGESLEKATDSGKRRWSLAWGSKEATAEEEREQESAATMYMLKMGIQRAVARQAGTAAMDATPLKAHLSLRYRFTSDGSYCPVKGLSTASKYEFEFEDYAPFVFRCIRRLQAVECSDFLRSICSGGLRTMDAAGKSGSHFFLSNDGRFVLKTMFEAEVTFFRSILDRYVAYMTKERSTLICHFYGLYTIIPQQGSVMHFIAMENILPRPEVPVAQIFDLKGSTAGRQASDADKQGPGPVILKDLDFDVPFLMGPTKLVAFFEQLRRDTGFLESCEIMDYSLLVGVVDLDQVQVVGRIPWALPEPLSVFRADDGGFRSSDAKDQPMNLVYYMGIIDVLQPYNLRKKVEHALKSLRETPDAISCVDPAQYSKRFVDFLMGNTASPVALSDRKSAIAPIPAPHLPNSIVSPRVLTSNLACGPSPGRPQQAPSPQRPSMPVSSQQLPSQVTWTPD